MKNPINRRKFLKIVAVTAGSLSFQSLAAACSQVSQTQEPTPISAPTLAPTPLPLPTETPVPPPAATNTTTTVPRPDFTSTPSPLPVQPVEPTATQTAVKPDLVVVRGGEPEALVRKALAALGGMEQFVRSGNVVVVKPNICVSGRTFDKAATTNPWVVAALVKMCLEAGASQVKVLDYPFSGESPDAYVHSGIQEQVLAAGGKMVPIAYGKFVKVQVSRGGSLKSCLVYEDVIKADVVINVPIAKHHSTTRLTLGMKSLMGVIHDRGAIHGAIWQRIPDLSTCIPTALTVIDAVRILMNNGPSGGSLNDVKKLDTLIASADVVAADSYATTLFGLQPADIPYIKIASSMGLGQMDLAKLKIEEIQA